MINRSWENLFESFSKLKFMNLLSVLHVERAYKLKKKEIQCLFPPVFGFDLINLDIVSSAESGDFFFKSADKSVEN